MSSRSEKSDDNRRKSNRSKAALVEYTRGEDEPKEPAFLKDVGVQGVCIIVSQELKLNEILLLDIYLSANSNPLPVKGLVIRVKETFQASPRKHYEVVVAFTSLGIKEKNRLLAYLNVPGEKKIHSL